VMNPAVPDIKYHSLKHEDTARANGLILSFRGGVWIKKRWFSSYLTYLVLYLPPALYYL